MSKRVLLVSSARNYPMSNEMYPSGALLLLGTILKQQGHTVRVVHAVADKVDIPKFCVLLTDFKPDIVGFAVSTYQTMWTRLMSSMVKIRDRSTTTVAGGSHPSALKAEFLNAFPSIDVAVVGEGEKAITDIAQDVPLRRISGICYREDGRIVSSQPAPLIADLDGLPLPDVSLINFKAYSGLFPVGRRPGMFIMSDRGCPYQCTFCSKAIYGNTLRLRSPESVMSEVRLLYRDWGVREVHFGNDTFNANLKWAHRLLDLIIQNGYHRMMTFKVALRVNEKILDMELLKHLKAANVWFVYYGVESGNQRMLDRMKKGITLPEIRRAFAMTHEAGIKTEAFFIVGLPGETGRTIEDSWNLYKEIKPFWGGFSKAMPFPGTELTKEVREKGHILHEDYDRFCPASMVVRTDEMTAEELGTEADGLNKRIRWEEIKHLKQVAYALWDKSRSVA